MDIAGPSVEGARASESQDDLKEREFQLKLLQAWADGKTKIATTGLLANGALLATAFAYMKDKGPDSPSTFALSAAEAGLRPIFQISVDKVWSALRFRPIELVKKRA